MTKFKKNVRPLRLYVDKEGKKYLIIKDKKYYIQTDKNGKELIKIVVNNFLSERKKRIRRKPTKKTIGIKSDFVHAYNNARQNLELQILDKLTKNDDRRQIEFLTTKLLENQKGMNLLTQGQPQEVPKIKAFDKNDINNIIGQLVDTQKEKLKMIQEESDLAISKNNKNERELRDRIQELRRDEEQSKSLIKNLDVDKNKVEKELQALQKEKEIGIKLLKKLESDLDNHKDLSKKQTDEIRKQKTDIEKLNIEAAKKQEELIEIASKTFDIEDDLDKTRETLKKYQEELNDAEKNLNEYKLRLEKIKKELQELEQTKEKMVKSTYDTHGVSKPIREYVIGKFGLKIKGGIPFDQILDSLDGLDETKKKQIIDFTAIHRNSKDKFPKEELDRLFSGVTKRELTDEEIKQKEEEKRKRGEEQQILKDKQKEENRKIEEENQLKRKQEREILQKQLEERLKREEEEKQKQKQDDLYRKEQQRLERAEKKELENKRKEDRKNSNENVVSRIENLIVMLQDKRNDIANRMESLQSQVHNNVGANVEAIKKTESVKMNKKLTKIRTDEYLPAEKELAKIESKLKKFKDGEKNKSGRSVVTIGNLKDILDKYQPKEPTREVVPDEVPEKKIVPISEHADIINKYEEEVNKSEHADIINKYEEEVNKSEDRSFGKSETGKGLLSTEIEAMMQPYNKLGFKGCFPIDKIGTIRPTKGQDKLSFIMNTGLSTTKGKHWIAVFIDKEDRSLEYFDPLADGPTKRFTTEIKKLIDKLNVPYYFKFKINKIKHQSDLSDSCGWFSMKFIIDRYDNKPFKECSGYSEVKKREKDIKDFKEKFGYI